METVRQRNIATEWWWSQTEYYRIHLCKKLGLDVKQAVPQLWNAGIAFMAFEKVTGKKIKNL
tara:strand:+ start:944 stop:1129 length:186 start_codon:yes stop_codon:yes gene_type:complete